jgi:hypothetical protein
VGLVLFLIAPVGLVLLAFAGRPVPDVVGALITTLVFGFVFAWTCWQKQTRSRP